MRRSAVFCLALVLITACGSASLEERVSTEPTATSTRPPTRTPTPTPSQTPTPTATAPPPVISGELREPLLSEAIRQSGAPCGFVDILDFPLDAPHGETALGGGDFGRYRNRFGGFHTGEDWREGASSLGKPVYSIGHGRVTYAQPNGWGDDKGVVIVQHAFRDGRRILSFYGHLDPPSVDLRAGQCTKRGDLIGAIGDSRSPPHLHFEIRVHLPETPGPGYWSIDPSQAGWRPPSATIWNERNAALPGVRWTHMQYPEPLRTIGITDGTVLASSEDGKLIALDAEDGRTQWERQLSETTNSFLLNESSSLVFVQGAGGIVEAYNLSDLADPNSIPPSDPVWSAKLGSSGSYDLVSLPSGGLLAFSRSMLEAISKSGEPLWSEELISGITGWAQADETLILLVRNEVWLVDDQGVTRSPGPIGGQRVIASEQPYMYAEDGVYQIDLESGLVEPFFELPSGYPRSGSLSEIPGGGVLVAHTDLGDKRLIAIEEDGSLRWERSIAGVDARGVELLTLEEEIYMMSEYRVGLSTGVDLFHVGAESGDLTRIFSGGTRLTGPNMLKITGIGELITIDITGVGLAAIEPQAALETVRDQ